MRPIARGRLAWVGALGLAVIVSSVALAAGSGGTEASGAASNGVKKLKKLKKKVNALEARLAALESRPPAQNGTPGQDGTNGTPGQDATAPAGAVMFFNLSACPSGWTELTAARGRYIVGLPASAPLGATAGTPLTSGENRSVGQHSHSVSDPGHSHTWSSTGTADSAGFSGIFDSASPSIAGTTLGGNSSTTQITILDSGVVTGTNAPYIQFLVCQKS
jgi:hypothetical protein